MTDKPSDGTTAVGTLAPGLARPAAAIRDALALIERTAEDPASVRQYTQLAGRLLADLERIDAQARGVEVVQDGERGLEVLGNGDEIALALGNLVSNAVTYSPDGGRVVVSARSEPTRVHLSVTDQGIGIPADEIDRIFERFYRVDPARHRSTGGTGLGLSIVKHVAATHGGDVRVWSVEGQGSTFTLELPSRTAPEAHASSNTSEENVR